MVILREILFCAGTSKNFCVDFENNCVKTSKGRPILSAAKNVQHLDGKGWAVPIAVVTAETEKFRIARFSCYCTGFLYHIQEEFLAFAFSQS